MKIGASNAVIDLLMHQSQMVQNINRTAAQVAMNTIEQKGQAVDDMIYKVIQQQQTNNKIVEIGMETMITGRLIDVFA